LPLPVSLARRPSNGRAGLGPALLVCVAILGPPPDRVLAGAPSADRPGFFTDVSRQLGLDFVHDPAVEGGYFMRESLGSGGAFLD